MSGKSLLKIFGSLLALVAVTLLIRVIVTGGYPTIKLSSTSSSLAGPVSVGIGQASSGPLPEIGKDYKIKSAEYFDNKEWVVVNILPIKSQGDPAFMVLKKIDGVYQTVLGPAGQFNGSYFYMMPLDVDQYLTEKGAYNG